MRTNSDSVSVTFDPELAQWRIACGLPGPAGVLRSRLDDLCIVVDGVDLSTLVEVTVDLPDCDPMGSPSLQAIEVAQGLFGQDVADLLAARPDGSAIATEADFANERRRDACALAARLVAVHELRSGDENGGRSSFWWSVEESCLRHSLAEANGPQALAQEAAPIEAASAAIDYAARSVDQLTADQRQRLVQRLRTLARAVHADRPDLAAALEGLEGRHLVSTADVEARFAALTADLPDFEEGGFDLAGRLQSEELTTLSRPRSAPEPDRAFPERFLVEHDEDLAPGIVEQGAHIVLDWYQDRDELRVSIPLRAGTNSADLAGLWVRVYVFARPGPSEMLDMSQPAIEPDHPDQAIARLLVPTHFSSGQLRLDLTNEPSKAPVPPAARSRARALHFGRLAAQAERLRSDDAVALWRACSREWRFAGDMGRAALALVRAARLVGDETAAEALREEARRLAAEPSAAWAAEYMEPLDEIEPALDQELFDPPTG